MLASLHQGCVIGKAQTPMSVRKRRWRDKQGRQHTRWMIHVEYTAPDGSKQTIRKVSPVQSKRGAEAFEREVRKQLFEGEWKESTKKQTPTLAAFAEEFLAFQATRASGRGARGQAAEP